jgi:hypothetical protein
MSADERHGGFGGAIILIGLGVLLLLDNLNRIEFDFWRMLFTLWPVFLILAGLDLVLGRRSGWWALLSIALSIAVLAGGVWLYQNAERGSAAAEGRAIRQSLGEAQAATIRLDPGLGELRLHALTEGDHLIAGNAEDGGAELEESFSMDNGRARYDLDLRGSLAFIPPFNEFPTWDLGLSRAVPLDLGLHLGFGDAEVDLSRLQIEALDVEMGLGLLRLTLPAEATFEGRVDGGIGELVILVPEGLPLRIDLDAGIAARSFPPEFERQEDRYSTPGFEDGQGVTLFISQGIGSVRVEWLEGR